MEPCPHLVSPDAPKGVEVFRLAPAPGVPTSHVYMEAQIFTPDSRRLVLHRPAHAHGSFKEDPEHLSLIHI